MIEYHWKGIDKNGLSCKGKTVAPCVEDLRKNLYEQGIALLYHKEPRLKRLFSYRMTTKNVSLSDFGSFFQHIGILLEHGIPLTKALQTCENQTSSTELKRLIALIIPDIEEGKNFAHAFQKHAPYLPFYVRSLLAVGQQTGSLGIICKNLSEHINANQALKRRVKSALLAPAITGIFAVIVTLLILVFIVPHFEQLFHTSRLNLPILTQRIFFISSTIRSPLGIGSICFAVLGIITLPRLISPSHLKQWAYSVGSTIPYFKNIVNMSTSLTFLEILSLYSKAGLPLVQSLEAAQILIVHPQFNASIRNLIVMVRQGNSLEQALEQSWTALCSPTVISLIGVGLQTGTIDSMLEKSVAWQRSELSKRLETASSLANPALMIILGGVITVLLVTIYLPIFNMALVPPL